MNVLIIGAGNMGRGIATRLVNSNANLIIHDIDAAKAQALATELGGIADSSRVKVTTSLTAAVATSDIVILASWYAVNLETARTLGSALDGKIVVDISNPLNENYDGLVTEPGTSAAEMIRAVLPADAKLLKAFNTTFAGTLVAGEVAGQLLDVFIAGDDDTAKRTLADLLRAGGLHPVDVGALERARQLEALGFLGITLQFRLNTGFGTAWKLTLPVAA
ncbi:MAG: NAD(P)-binding domain-containing protein [Gemmatimonas sp.]